MNRWKPKIRGSSHYKQGYYKPKNPSKYVGDPSCIRFLSGLELTMFRFLDNNEKIIRWNSEGFRIPYFDRSTNKKRIYMVDLFVEYTDKKGRLVKALIEIKPSKKLAPPKKGKNYQARMCEQVNNLSKWDAAKKYAESHGMVFLVMTEENIK